MSHRVRMVYLVMWMASAVVIVTLMEKLVANVKKVSTIIPLVKIVIAIQLVSPRAFPGVVQFHLGSFVNAKNVYLVEFVTNVNFCTGI